MNVSELPEVPNLTVQTIVVSVCNQVSLATKAEAQAKDSVLGLVIQGVCKGDKPKGLVIFKVCSKAVKSICFNLIKW